MIENNINNTNNDSAENELSLVELFFHYLSYWKLFLISIFLCLGIAILYLRYTVKEYKVVSSVVIKDDKKGQTGVDMTAFSDLGILTQNSNVDNELEVLRSKTLMKRTVDSLGLGVSYFKKGKIIQTELYKKSPLFVSVLNYTRPGKFIIEKGADNTFRIKSEDDDFERTVKLNEEFDSPWGLLALKENPWGSAEFPVVVTIHNPQALPELTIASASKTSSVVDLSYITACPEKAQDMIDMLVDLYNRQAINEKNYAAKNTIDFIEERLGDISGELKTAEKNVEQYRQQQGLTDVKAEAELFLSTTSEYSKKVTDGEIQLDVLRSIKSFITSPENKSNLVPANVGLTDPTIISLIQEYNTQLNEKARTTTGMKSTNPILMEYEARIASLRENLLKGINIAESGMLVSLRELNRQENLYAGKARHLSTQERESRELYRQKEIKESLFIYLLQKKEETALSLAMATPNAKIIDRADFSPSPVKPKIPVILLAALLLGVIIPVAIIYIRDLFDTKIHTKDDLTRVIKAPFIGEIPVSKSDEPLPVQNLRSGIAEKFRVVASNLSFITEGRKNPVILVTSSVSGEGKSFFTQNLALSMATSGKKTLLIDLDIRKSVMAKKLELHPEKGVAIYLSDPETTVKDIIDTSGVFHKNFHFIPTKYFPPNPAELLASERLDRLFEVVREEYDCVIVDSAPIGLVADAYRLNQFANATIYVTRADYTHKNMLLEIQELYRNKKLHNMTVVLNGANPSGRYGYGAYKHDYYLEK